MSTLLGESVLRSSKNPLLPLREQTSKESPRTHAHEDGRVFPSNLNGPRIVSVSDSGYGSLSVPEHDSNGVESGVGEQRLSSQRFYRELPATSSDSPFGPISSNISTLATPSKLGSRNPYRSLDQPSQLNFSRVHPYSSVSAIVQNPIPNGLETQDSAAAEGAPDSFCAHAFSSSSDNTQLHVSTTQITTPERPHPATAPHSAIQQDDTIDRTSLPTVFNATPPQDLDQISEPLGALAITTGTNSSFESVNSASAAFKLLSLWTKHFIAAPSHHELIPFDTGRTEQISRTYHMDRMAPMPSTLVHRWNKAVKPQLDQDLQGLITCADFGKEVILSNVQLCMAGVKRGNTLHAQPTIVITCGTKECKRKLAKALGKLNLHYLIDFGRPIKVRYQPSPSYWAASTINLATVVKGESYALDLRQLRIQEPTKQVTSCGLKLEFSVLRQDMTPSQVYSSLGGILCIGGVFYGMTTAHTFLAKWNKKADRKGRQGLEPLSQYGSGRTLPGSIVYDGLAYSFLGQVARVDGQFDAYESSASDWALFALPQSCILPNINRPSERLTFVSPQSQLTAGEVHILHGVEGRYSGFLTQPCVSFHMKNKVMDVREVALDTPLPCGASGSWVVRDYQVCGYIVAITGLGRSCFMVPMERAFQDIEAVFGQRIVFGWELHEAIRRLKVRNSHPRTVQPSQSDLDNRLLNACSGIHQTNRRPLEKATEANGENRISDKSVATNPNSGPSYQRNTAGDMSEKVTYSEVQPPMIAQAPRMGEIGKEGIATSSNDDLARQADLRWNTSGFTRALIGFCMPKTPKSNRNHMGDQTRSQQDQPPKPRLIPRDELASMYPLP